MNGILAATLMVGGTGLLIGILLGIAGKKFLCGSGRARDEGP